MRWASKKVANTFQRQKLPQDCPKYHQCYETNVQIHWFMIFQDSVLMQLSPKAKVTGHLKERHTNMEGNDVSYSIRHRSCALHFKYAEQTDNCEAGRICSVSWVKHSKVERTKTRSYTNSMQKFSFVQIQRLNRMSVSCNVSTQWEAHLPMGLLTCAILRDRWLNVSWCGVDILSESTSIQVNMIMWEVTCVINYFSEDTVLLEKVLILVIIFRMFPISCLRLKKSFSHMPTIFTLPSYLIESIFLIKTNVWNMKLKWNSYEMIFKIPSTSVT
jgi:hypothetical protein